MQLTQFTKHIVEKEIVIHKCFKRMLYIGTVFPFNMYFAIKVAHFYTQKEYKRYTQKRHGFKRESSKFPKQMTTHHMFLLTQWDHGKISREKEANKYFKDQNNHLLLELELRYHLALNYHFTSEKN